MRKEGSSQRNQGTLRNFASIVLGRDPITDRRSVWAFENKEGPLRPGAVSTQQDWASEIKAVREVLELWDGAGSDQAKRSCVFEKINAQLPQCAEVQISAAGKLEETERDGGLHAFLWLQLARFVTGRRLEMFCKRETCNKKFEARHTKAKFCSAKCKMVEARGRWKEKEEQQKKEKSDHRSTPKRR